MTANDISQDALRNVPPSADEDVAKLRLQLSHLSFSELEQKGLVNWDIDRDIVTKGLHFSKKRPEKEIDRCQRLTHPLTKGSRAD